MGDTRETQDLPGDSQEMPERRNASNHTAEDQQHDHVDPKPPSIVQPGSRNRYAIRKTAAQGMMDVSLLLANASQLKSVVSAGPSHNNYVFLLTLISISITLQVITGILLIVVGSRESKCKVDEHHHNDKCAHRLNNVTTGMIFLITVDNIFIASFGIGDTGSQMPTQK